MRGICQWSRTGKRISLIPTYSFTPEPPPEAIAKRPHLPPSFGTSYPVDEHLDAQQDWLAHIAAGRIKIG